MVCQENSKYVTSRINNRCWLLLVYLILLPHALLADNSTRIAVLYPESNNRAISKLYNTIVQNMLNNPQVMVQSRALSVDDSVDDIKQWLVDEKSQAVIFLGKQGQNFSMNLKLAIPLVTGAHIGVKVDHSAVSLAADPDQLFNALKTFEPDIKHVHVIYHEANSGWLMKKAHQAAKKNQLNLNAMQSANVQASGQLLKKVIEQADTYDAIWLPFDPILPIKPLLPELLKKAWEKNLIIFSSNPYHVRRGILFALYPDYSKLGQQLIDLALIKINKNGQVHHQPSLYLNSAINTRTASHLGIQISSRQVNNFNLVFPAKK